MISLAQRDRIGVPAARRLARLSARHRRELIRLMGNPPDPTRIPPEFWQKVRVENENEMAAMLAILFAAMADKVKLSPERLPDARDRFVAERSQFLSQRYTQTSQKRIADIGRQFQDRQQRGLDIPKELITRKTLSVFGPDRASTIATTEITNADRAANEERVSEINGGVPPDEQGRRIAVKLTWVLGPCKHCTFCPLIAGQPASFYSQFIIGPPAHARCCCGLQIVSADQREPPRPSHAQVVAAARESGVFGY